MLAVRMTFTLGSRTDGAIWARDSSPEYASQAPANPVARSLRFNWPRRRTSVTISANAAGLSWLTTVPNSQACTASAATPPTSASRATMRGPDQLSPPMIRIATSDDTSARSGQNGLMVAR